MRNFFLPIVLSFLVASCATPEFKMAENECTIIAFQQYPRAIARVLTQRTDWVEVYDGSMHCEIRHHKGRDFQHCFPGTTMVAQTTPVYEDVDLNTAPRNAYIENCTAQKCLAQYGNVECKTP